MFLIPFVLVACNPEHNPDDVAELIRLEGVNTKLGADLTAANGEVERYQAATSEQTTEIRAYMVVARAYLDATKQSGNLVVCQPKPPVLSDFMDPTQPMPAAPAHTEPWVQAEVTSDCNLPLVLDLTRDPGSQGTLASINADEGTDGPQLTNAPTKADEDME